MADNEKKITIEIFRKKLPEELTKSFADPDSRCDAGSAAALTAASAAALLARAAARTPEEGESAARVAYIARNAEILRTYMLHLIDEDVKCRGPLRRALKEGGAQEIEAAREPATAITAEIVNMMGSLLELGAELRDLAPAEACYLIASAADLAMGAVKASIRYILDMGSYSSDETYRYVLRRQNEMTLERYASLYAAILGEE